MLTSRPDNKTHTKTRIEDNVFSETGEWVGVVGSIYVYYCMCTYRYIHLYTSTHGIYIFTWIRAKCMIHVNLHCLMSALRPACLWAPWIVGKDGGGGGMTYGARSCGNGLQRCTSATCLYGTWYRTTVLPHAPTHPCLTFLDKWWWEMSVAIVLWSVCWHCWPMWYGRTC